MNKLITGLSLTIVLCGTLMAQKKVDTNASANAGQTTNVGSAIASGTRVSGQLQNSLDVQKAKVGDQVLLKTTKAVKQDGQVVIAKGSTLVGHVTEVARKSKGNAGSSLGIMFDSIRLGNSQMPINASITSVLQATTAASVDSLDNMSVMSSSSGQASARSSSSGAGGGLLGGVTNTVGGVANSAGQTVGGLTNTIGQTTTTATGSLAGTVPGLSISQSSSTSAQGGSLLSTSNGNIHLDKGTTFNLSIANSTSISKNQPN